MDQIYGLLTLAVVAVLATYWLVAGILRDYGRAKRRAEIGRMVAACRADARTYRLPARGVPLVWTRDYAELRRGARVIALRELHVAQRGMGHRRRKSDRYKGDM